MGLSVKYFSPFQDFKLFFEAGPSRTHGSEPSEPYGERLTVVFVRAESCAGHQLDISREAQVIGVGNLPTRGTQATLSLEPVKYYGYDTDCLHHRHI